MKFFEKFLKREAEAEDLEEAIIEWHNHPTSSDVLEHLGMTLEQYDILLNRPEEAEDLRSDSKISASYSEKIKKSYSNEA